MISLQDYLFLSSALFSLGIFAILTRRNAVSILMGIELILNSAGINFVAFSHYIKPFDPALFLSGQVFTIFIILLAASEAVVALAIILAIYQNRSTIEVDKTDTLKG